MEYGGLFLRETGTELRFYKFQPGIVHEEVPTKTYDINQRDFLRMLDATTEDGQEFSFQCAKSTDPVYAVTPTKK
eukprot:726261-Amphidinium_carterae.1